MQNGLHLSRSTVVYFKHNDMASLASTLEKLTRGNKRAEKIRRYIVVESIYQVQCLFWLFCVDLCCLFSCPYGSLEHKMSIQPVQPRQFVKPLFWSAWQVWAWPCWTLWSSCDCFAFSCSKCFTVILEWCESAIYLNVNMPFQCEYAIYLNVNVLCKCECAI